MEIFSQFMQIKHKKSEKDTSLLFGIHHGADLMHSNENLLRQGQLNLQAANQQFGGGLV